MYTINNNDIDINGDSPIKLYNGKYITKYIDIPISEVKYNWKGKLLCFMLYFFYKNQLTHKVILLVAKRLPLH